MCMTSQCHTNVVETTKKEQILGITEHRRIANLETIARDADICRMTAEKYLNQLIAEGKIRELRVGNNRLFVSESEVGC